MVNSCHMFAPTGVQSYCYEIIPGERLASSNLARTQTENLVKDDCYFLSFQLDFAEAFLRGWVFNIFLRPLG